MADSNRSTPADCEVAILGAGVAGMAAAYEVRERDILVLESEDRVGGRTLTYGDDHAWANLGAQVVTAGGGARELAEELGLELVDVSGADVGLAIDGKLTRASRAEFLLPRLPLSLVDKAAFGVTMLRLRRLLRTVRARPEQADQQSLQDLIGSVRSTVQEILTRFCIASTALFPSEISGAIGLGYSLETYLNPKAHGEAAVRGGSQRIAEAIERMLDPGRVRLGARVSAVTQDDSGVRVLYVAEGQESEVRARACICALPAPHIRGVVAGISEEKQAALEAMTPYNRVMSVAWPLKTQRPAPWDGLAMVAMVGDSFAFNLFINHSFYVDRTHLPATSPPGYLVMLSSRGVPNSPLDVSDSEALDRGLQDLTSMFPAGRDHVDTRGGRVQRWIGLPPFAPGFLRLRHALREPTGRVRYCGDYTAEPGLAGAARSGRAVGRAVALKLGEPPVARPPSQPGATATGSR